METFISFLSEHWLQGLGLSTVLLTIILRLLPTEKNRDLLRLIFKFLDAIIPNLRKGGGTHNLKVILLVCLPFAGLSQTYGTFKGVRFVNVLDSTQVLPVNGSIYYNEQSKKFRVYENNVWKDLISAGGSGIDSIKSGNGLTVIGTDSVILGGTLIQNTSITGTFDIDIQNTSIQPHGFYTSDDILQSSASLYSGQTDFSNSLSLISAAADGTFLFSQDTDGSEYTVIELSTPNDGSNDGHINITASGDNNITSAGIMLTGKPTGLNTISFTGASTFTPTIAYSGLNVGTVSGDPSSLANGDLWYNSATDNLRARINGASVSLGAGGLTTADNGLTATGSNVQLGGALIQNTTITVPNDGSTTFTTDVPGIPLFTGHTPISIGSNNAGAGFTGFQLKDNFTSEFTPAMVGIFSSIELSNDNIGVQGKLTADTNGNRPGFNTGSISGDPFTLINGDLWYNSTTNSLNTRINSLSGKIPFIDVGVIPVAGRIPYFSNASAEITYNNAFNISGTTLSIPGNLLASGRGVFTTSSTSGGVNPGAVNTDPSAPANGDIWYNSAVNQLKARINGNNVSLSASITNTASNNELAKSDGTNLVTSGLEIPSTSNLNLGLAGTTGSDRTLSTNGTSTNINLLINPKGTGEIQLGDNLRISDFSVIYALQSTNAIRLNGATGNGTNIHGGDAWITGGNGFTNGDGGDVNIQSGSKNGTGIEGNININPQLGHIKTPETGSAPSMGIATLVAGTVTINNAKITANTRIFYSVQTAGGTQGFLRISARTVGTSFTITSTSGTDTSTVAWLLIEP